MHVINLQPIFSEASLTAGIALNIWFSLVDGKYPLVYRLNKSTVFTEIYDGIPYFRLYRKLFVTLSSNPLFSPFIACFLFIAAQCGSRFWSVYPQPTLLFIHVWPDHQTGWGKITGSPSTSIGFIWDKRAACPTIDRSGSVRGFEEILFWEQYPMNLPPRPLALPFFALKRARNASYTRVTRERLVTKRKGQWEGFHLPAFLCSQIFIDRGTFEENAMGSLSESTMRGNILIIVLINIMLSLMSASWSLVKPTWMPRQFFKGGKWLTVMVMFILDSQTCQSGKRTIYWACYPY